METYWKRGNSISRPLFKNPFQIAALRSSGCYLKKKFLELRNLDN